MTDFKIGDRVVSRQANLEGVGTVVADTVGVACGDVSVRLDPPAKQSSRVGYWYLRPENLVKPSFREGDRVVISSRDSFDGKTGEVKSIEPWTDGIDYLVQIDGRSTPTSFEEHELSTTPLKRLTVTVDERGTISRKGRQVVIEGSSIETREEEIDPTCYVQVDYSGDRPKPPFSRYRALYTYIDPTGGDLQVGDEVEVPVTYGTKVGVVAALGRGNWTGECKSVIARITRVAL